MSLRQEISWATTMWGYPLGHIFSGKTTGIDPATGIYKYVLRPDITITEAADYRQFENYLFYVGTSNAPWTGGFSTTFSYKRVSLGISGNFSIGAKILNDITSPASYSKAGESYTQVVPTSKNDLYVNHLNVVRDVTYRWDAGQSGDRRVSPADRRIRRASAGPVRELPGQSPAAVFTTITNCSRLEDVSYLIDKHHIPDIPAA